MPTGNPVIIYPGDTIAIIFNDKPILFRKDGDGFGSLTVDGVLVGDVACAETAIDFIAGQSLTLGVLPEPGSVVSAWTLNGEPISGGVTLLPGDTMTVWLTLVATPTPPPTPEPTPTPTPEPITITKDGDGSGSVLVNSAVVCDASYSETEIQFVDGEIYTFEGWKLNGVFVEGIVNVLPGDSVTAIFTRIPPPTADFSAAPVRGYAPLHCH